MSEKIGLTDIFYKVVLPSVFRTALILHSIDSRRCWKHSSEIFITIDMIALNSCTAHLFMQSYTISPPFGGVKIVILVVNIVSFAAFINKTAKCFVQLTKQDMWVWEPCFLASPKLLIIIGFHFCIWAPIFVKASSVASSGTRDSLESKLPKYLTKCQVRS